MRPWTTVRRSLTDEVKVIKPNFFTSSGFALLSHLPLQGEGFWFFFPTSFFHFPERNFTFMKSKLHLAAAMAVFGTLPLFVRNIPLSSSTLALCRAIIAAGFLVVLRAVMKNPIRFNQLGKDAVPLFFSGAAMGFNWILLFEAYKYTTVSVATLSYYFAPVIVTVVSAILFREKLTAKQTLCFAGSTVGLILVIGLNNLTGSVSLKGVGFGLGAAVLYATVILFNKRIRSVSGIDRTVLQFIAAAAVLIPYITLTEGFSFASMTGAGWLNLMVVCLIHTGIAYVLYFTALPKLRGQEVSILSYIDPLLACVISFTILHEPTTALQLVGGAMILGFTLLNEVGNAD